MISIDEINKEILVLEKKDTSYAVMERLAWLYIVRDHMQGIVSPVSHEKTIEEGNTEFLLACSNQDTHELLKLLDEHMSVVQLMMPKEYYAVIYKMKKMKKAME